MAPRKKKFEPLPVDDARHPNTSPFRVVERSFKRRLVSSSPSAFVRPPESTFLPALPLFVEERLYDPLNLLDGITPTSSSAYAPFITKIPALDLSFIDGEKSTEEIRALTFPTHPGLILIPRALSETCQRTLIKQCLRDWARRPNVTNLDTHYVINGEDGIWGLYESEWLERKKSGGTGKDTIVERRTSEGSESYPDDQLHHDENTAQLKIDPPTTGTPLLTPMPVSDLIKRWRWCSLGWQYNWSKKIYHMDRPVPFPAVLNNVAKTVIGSVQSITGYMKDDFTSEAGIINFYQLADSLTAHQDRSEINMDAPLVSFRYCEAA
ncbi:hypothetical protein HDU83_008392 [Entophlyctis luteolus]|nr:hypothetical protein HDU83_008392 [Entophlyctis luteolus]KAJ3376791.1 hypothetical protein HDU84_009398 [Entophlyctis sp. JEL0112]